MVRRTHYLNLIRPFIGSDIIKVITGIRRCGKSVLLEQIRDEIVSQSPKTKIVYLDLEDKANEHFLRGTELFDFLESELKGRCGAVFQWDGASIPVVSTLKACSGAAPLLVGFGQPEGHMHSPNESYGLNQFARAMAWAEKILAALAD